MNTLATTRSIYTDGGLLSPNPSALGGTYSYLFLDANGAELGTETGLVLPEGTSCGLAVPRWYCALPAITNNITELCAVVFALQQLPAGFMGTVYTDSWVTLCRMQNARTTWTGVPPELQEAAEKEKARHPDLPYSLLDGHPNPEQLKAGIGKRGNPVSKWNVLCDERCTDLKQRFRERVTLDAAKTTEAVKAETGDS